MSTEEKLINASKQIRKGLLSNNIDLLSEYYCKDFQGFSIRGEIEDLDLILEFYKPGAVKLESYDIKEQTAEVFGEVGIIRGRGYLEGVYGEYPFEHHVIFTDIYRCSDGNWKCYRSHITEIDKPE